MVAVKTASRASNNSTSRRATNQLTVTACAVPASFVLFNPWGLIGRHEIRLLVCWVALGLGIRAIARLGVVSVPRGWQSWLGFLGLAALSTIVAGDWRTTIIGHDDRHLGLVGIVSLGAAAFVGANLSAEGRHYFRFVLEAATAVVAVTAIGQLVVPAVFGEAAADGRPTTMFGSATYTGASLALGLPLWLDRVLAPQTGYKRIAMSGTAGAVVLALVLSGSRGAWIGGILGISATLWRYRAEQRRLVASVVAAGVAVLAFAVVTSGTVRGRVNSLLSPTEGTAGGRLELWRSGLRAMVERPLLGWGPDRTRIALPPSLPASFEATYWDQTIPDRTHNAVIDIAVVIGIPAAVLLVVGMATLLLRATRTIDDSESSAESVWTIVLLAHVPHLLFNFVQLDIDLAVAVIAGFLVQSHVVQTRPAVSVRAATSTVATIATGTALVFGVGLVVADTLAANGVKAERRGDLEGAANSYSNATSWSFGSARYHEVVARFERRQGNQLGAIEAAAAAAQVHDDDLFFSELHALTLAEATQLDPKFGIAALKNYEGLIQRWPNHGAYHTGTGVAHVLLGDTTHAEQSFQRAITISPLSPEPYHNLAQLYIELDRPAEARAVLDAGLDASAAPEQLTGLRESIP